MSPTPETEDRAIDAANLLCDAEIATSASANMAAFLRERLEKSGDWQLVEATLFLLLRIRAPQPRSERETPKAED